jgi:hypothetical protein
MIQIKVKEHHNLCCCRKCTKNDQKSDIYLIMIYSMLQCLQVILEDVKETLLGSGIRVMHSEIQPYLHKL